MTSKTCGVCGVVKALVLFDRSRVAPDGHRNICKACRKQTAAKETA